MSEAGTILKIRRPDDWHVHLRDEEILRTVAPYTAREFGRSLIMPNLKPPVRTVEDAIAYRERIKAVVPNLDLVMTLYLTDETSPEQIFAASKTEFIRACKLYPAGATTNSAHGVTSMEKIHGALQAMEQSGMILCIHGEVTSVDMFDREKKFVTEVLGNVLKQYPKLKVVLEHVSSKEAVDFILQTDSPNIAATVTPQHLCFDRGALFEGSRLHHDMFCLPVLKTKEDKEAIRAAVASGSRRFFAGTDSAPHPREAKMEGSAGVFSAPAAVELYAEAFDELNALPLLEAFLSENGADFYGVMRNEGTVTLEKKPFAVPAVIPIVSEKETASFLSPMRAGESLSWTLTDS